MENKENKHENKEPNVTAGTGEQKPNAQLIAERVIEASSLLKADRDSLSRSEECLAILSSLKELLLKETNREGEPKGRALSIGRQGMDPEGLPIWKVKCGEVKALLCGMNDRGIEDTTLVALLLHAFCACGSASVTDLALYEILPLLTLPVCLEYSKILERELGRKIFGEALIEKSCHFVGNTIEVLACMSKNVIGLSSESNYRHVALSAINCATSGEDLDGDDVVSRTFFAALRMLVPYADAVYHVGLCNKCSDREAVVDITSVRTTKNVVYIFKLLSLVMSVLPTEPVTMFGKSGKRPVWCYVERISFGVRIALGVAEFICSDKCKAGSETVTNCAHLTGLIADDIGKRYSDGDLESAMDGLGEGVTSLIKFNDEKILESIIWLYNEKSRADSPRRESRSGGLLFKLDVLKFIRSVLDGGDGKDEMLKARYDSLIKFASDKPEEFEALANFLVSDVSGAFDRCTRHNSEENNAFPILCSICESLITDPSTNFAFSNKGFLITLRDMVNVVSERCKKYANHKNWEDKFVIILTGVYGIISAMHTFRPDVLAGTVDSSDYDGLLSFARRLGPNVYRPNQRASHIDAIEKFITSKRAKIPAAEHSKHPSDLLDEITGERLVDPVELPETGHVVNSDTALHAILSRGANPFSKEPMTKKALLEHNCKQSTKDRVKPIIERIGRLVTSK